MLKVASIFAVTEQSIFKMSVVCKTILPPVNTSKVVFAGMVISFTNKTVSFVSVSL